MDLSELEPTLDVIDARIASEYQGDKDVAYTEEAIKSLTPDEIREFANVFGFDPDEYDDQTNRDRIFRILYFLNMISDYKQVLTDPNVIGVMCQQMNVEDLNNYRIANNLKEINCQFNINDPDNNVKHMNVLNDQTAKLALQIEKYGSTEVIEKAFEQEKHSVVTKLIGLMPKSTIDAVTMNTLLYKSVIHKRPDTFCMLLEKGADPNTSLGRGWTILTMAATIQSYEMVECALKHGANTEIPGFDGETPIIIAARTQNLPIVKLLTEYNANLDFVPQERTRTHALGAATSLGDLNIINYLLDHGANIEIQTQDGLTPLMLAAVANKIEAAKLLLKRGANLDATGNTGMRAVDLAAVLLKPTMVNLLHRGEPTLVSRIASWFGQAPEEDEEEEENDELEVSLD